MAYLISLILSILGIIKKKSNIVFIIIGAWIWVLMAFSSGIADEAVYIGRYEHYQLFTGQTEPGYTLLMYLFNTAGLPYQTYKMIICAIEISLIMSTIFALSKNKNFVLSLYMIYPLCMDAVQMRFTLGLSIVIFGMRFLSVEYVNKYNKRKISADLLYAIFVIIASLFHSVCILYLLLLVAKRAKRKSIILVSLAVVLLFLIFLNGNSLLRIGELIGVGYKVQDVLTRAAMTERRRFFVFAFRMFERLALFLVIPIVAKYGLKRRNAGIISYDFIINANIILMSILALLQYSIDFSRVQIGMAILNNIFASNYLIDHKSKNKMKINKGNAVIILVSIGAAFANLYILVLNSNNINTVFIPFFTQNSLLGGK